ncbi:MAG TPA: hypothetical protein VJ656_15595 [Pyrinomonadaceae bacterium]|nr:hypothetical protein [Pyrinomonadaceae bacterium]
MSTKYQIIVDVWERMEKEVVGAPELELIQQALAVRFGTIVSLASIARTLADHGAHLAHPDVLSADLSWRERTSLFTPADLGFANLEAANGLLEKIEGLRQNFENDKPMLEHLRQSVQQIKNELDVLASSDRVGQNILAQEVGQWLTIWLQNPQIFPEWLALRRNTPEFRERFM